jgi:hypothetical protein
LSSEEVPALQNMYINEKMVVLIPLARVSKLKIGVLEPLAIALII